MIDHAEAVKTLVTGVMVPLQVWVLMTVHRLAKSSAVQEHYGKAHDRELLDMRVRLARVEAKLVELETIVKGK